MSTINESISRVRELLDYPMENHPSLHRVYGALIRHIQHCFNELNNTGQAWTYASENVVVAADTDTYTLSATNFGKPIGVVTYSTDDSSFETRIPFFEVQNLSFEWGLPRNAAAGFWQTDTASTHSAMRVAFYRTAGTNTVKMIFRPVPKAAATYTVHYSVGDWTDDVALTATPLLSEHHSMFEIPAALSLLPSAQWSGDENDQERRANLLRSLQGEYQLFRPAWTAYIAEQTHSGMGFREVSYL